MTAKTNFLSGLFGKKHEEAAPPAPEITPPTERSAPADEAGPNFFQRLTSGLSRSSQKLSDGVAAIFTKKKLDAETLSQLEELLIAADLGVSGAAAATAAISKDRFDREITDNEVKEALAVHLAGVLKDREKPLAIDPAKAPHVILVVGVNGGGKTTTIGKLAARFRAEGRRVALAAGDTFRAAAVEQLKVWAGRTGASFFAKETGADAAALSYEALTAAKAAGADVLLIDTAGRLQNRKELMDELAKIVRVIRKIDQTAPHDVLLVLDATVGQNALSQADVFREIAGVTGLVMTKLDGTARGGVLVALAERHPLPIHFIGVGEGIGDLQPFEARSFARALAGLERL
ncbi:MAG TPA: signal recognition particle-docking protein FtsY [Parvularcula sp.]|nr:signal recognition particle-docking protein FtsY [Parvularcula sp.]HBS32220.1 signal recognition particle-docking protein FtsY [Parvularcula sp.]HBS35788.1 signal recognition particle-docking protein FtsY [Parvularcula sp.]